MALGDERRAIGRANAAERQAIGYNNAADRRAIQDRNTAERRGSSVQDDINSLIRPEKQSAQLRTVEPRGSLPATRGSAPYVAPKTSSGAGGIASPVTEKTKVVSGQTVPDREYWPTGLTSSDGLFVLPAIKTQNMADANGADVVFQFANPAGTV